MRPAWVDNASYIQRCFKSYNDVAPEMLLTRSSKLPHIELGAEIYSIGVVLERCGTENPLQRFQTRGMKERQDASRNQLVL